MKVCSRCKNNLPDECYHKAAGRKSGLQPKCKDCRRECLNADKEKERKSKWYQEHKEHANCKSDEWVERNKEKRKEIARNYYHNNKDEVKIRMSSPERRKKRSKYIKMRRESDPAFKISGNLRNSIRKYIVKTNDRLKFRELIGCSVQYLIEHLENKFVDGMSWENYGKEWHVDHIKPCTKFDLTDKDQQKLCYHFSNLQPLWATENIIKSNKWEDK
jgi:hypothetical protein